MSNDHGLFVAAKHAGSETRQHVVFAANEWSRLSQWVQQNGFKGAALHQVLDWDQYHLYQVEPPSVPQEELNQALLFSLRDRLEYPLNETQLDSFPVPDDSRHGPAARINVVVSHLPTLARSVRQVNSCNLSMSQIDVPDLVLRSLLDSDPTVQQRGVCVLAYRRRQLTMLIYRQEQLYLTRTITGLAEWDDYLIPDSPDLRESLLLEMQRTLDYYQSQLGQPPVAQLLLPDWSQPLEDLLSYFNQNLSTETQVLESPSWPNDTTAEARRALMMADAAVQGAQRYATD